MIRTRTLTSLLVAAALTGGSLAAAPQPPETLPAAEPTDPTNPTAGDATVEVEEVDTRIPVQQPTDAGEPVTLDARVVVPDAAACPCPAVVWNHGFGGSKTGDGGERRELASHGYVVLSYTSRGFGDTPGQVDLMGPKEVQDQLDAVDWLIDPDNPVVGGMVIEDAVGQYGASYGGFHAWALARSGHPAVRTTVPTATGTHLYEAIAPNDVEMLAWANGFYATGYRPEDDNYSQTFHRVVHEMNTGINNQDVRVEMAARATKGRWNTIRIPVFIIQGINDALFPANQAVEAYEELTARGLDARLYLGGIGHPPAVDGGAEVDHIEELILQWFDHHLKGEHTPIVDQPPVTVAETGYFDWEWDGTVRRAEGIGGDEAASFHLCTETPVGGTLSAEPCPDALPLVLGNGVAGSGLAHEPVTSDYMREFGFPGHDESQLPTVATYDAPPVVTDTVLDLAGIPEFQLDVSSVAQVPADLRGAAAAFQLDPKVYDVAPDGSATLLTRGAFAERVDAQEAGSTPRHTVRFDAFGTYHQLEAGHHLRITLATEDVPYLRPTTHPFTVTVHPGSQVRLPTGEWLGPSVRVGPPPAAA